MLVNALVWLAFAAVVALGMHPSLPTGDLVSVGVAGLALLAAVILVFLALLLRRRSRWGFILTVAALAVLAILTIADQVGFVDLVVLAIVVTPLVLLIKDRGWYMGSGIEAASDY
jgi:hypothetical protein